MNRTEIIGDFADKIGVTDECFEAWREAHVQQDYYASLGLHILCDSRWNQFAVYHQNEKGECRLIHTNIAL